MRDVLGAYPAPRVGADGQDVYVVPNQFIKPSQADMSEFLRSLSSRNVQTAPTGVPAPSTILATNGLSLSVGGGGVPPDTNGDVSPTHFIQWINTSWAIFDKTTGARLNGPTAGNSFFAGFGGRCQDTNAGDPLAIWDDRAQRWVMSQFTTGATASQCFAISTTSDPLGTYYRYEFVWPSNTFGDYPHIGIWTDESAGQNAYTIVTHEFNTAGTSFLGAAFTAVQRDKMLAGAPAAQVGIVRFPGFDAYGAEPVHLDGTLNAKAGSCAPFIHFDPATSEYLFWDMCINWVTPASSTLNSTPTRVASRTPFVPNYTAVPQLGSSVPLDAFGTHIMYRAAARAFPPGSPTRMSLVVNHGVLGANEQGSIRWTHFDLAKANDRFDRIFADGFQAAGTAAAPLTKSIVDEGVYSPDTNNRWMGGIAIDKGGNIGVGYNVSSATINPRLMINGRALNDADGTLRDEQACTPATTGSQTGSFSGRGRWGDYTSMSVDPTDDCTFWFTGEFYPTTSTNQWSTRICSFKFAECGQPGFKLVSQTPQRIEICGTTPGADPSWDLLAGTVGGFNSSVTLTATGMPGGTTPSFTLNPINPTPGSSLFTLVGGHGAASGEYTVNVSGTGGAITSAINLELGVSAAAPAAPTLTAPANGATGTKVRPQLTWTAVPGALTYIVEVASDAGFANIVASKTVTTNSWTVDTTLNSTTQYFWRVRPGNYCGNGAQSAAFSFTTGTPGTCPAGTTLTNVATYGFEGGAEPAWTAGAPGDLGGTAWSVGTPIAGTTGFTGNVWKVPNNTVSSDRSVLSPSIAIPAAQAVILSFDTYHSFETDPPSGCWDAASLEAKVGAGSFAQLLAGRFFTDSYNGTISAGAPLAGRGAWCYQPSTGTAAKRSIVDLDDMAGQTIQLRFRATSDTNTAATAPNGMEIDNVKIDVCN